MKSLKGIIQRNKLTFLSLATAGMIIPGINNGGIEYRADPKMVRAGLAYFGLNDSSWVKPPPLLEVEYEVFDKVENVVSELENTAERSHETIVGVLDSIDTAIESSGNYLLNNIISPEVLMEGFYLPKEAESRYGLIAAHGKKRLLEKAQNLDENFGGQIKASCIEYKIPYDIAFTIILMESGGNVNAKSHTGVKGIAQITSMTKTHVETHYKSAGRSQPINCSKSSEDNIECAVMLMKMMRKRFKKTGLSENENWDNVIAGYNRGSFGLGRDLRDAEKKHVLDLTEGELPTETFNYIRKSRAYQALLHTYGFFEVNEAPNRSKLRGIKPRQE